METIYWGLFTFGLLYAIVVVIFGEIVSHFLDGLSGQHHSFFNPSVMVSGLTTLGASGIVLTQSTQWHAWSIFVISLSCAILISVCTYFVYVRSMRNNENSVAFSIQDLTGKMGEVIVPIPPSGYGEVMIRIGAGVTNQIASSFDNTFIPSGATIVVIEVDDHTLHVSHFDELSAFSRSATFSHSPNKSE
ncbi:NfeD family protein [Paenibacillus sp. 481]|uniref:NfeD family protein n=1 Tax=Paenibacillus sp. 481 TaxID=2835869 RepID=UPI001E2964A8|nr:NfeD family protein [Paenibacillus sp. 481]